MKKILNNDRNLEWKRYREKVFCEKKNEIIILQKQFDCRLRRQILSFCDNMQDQRQQYIQCYQHQLREHILNNFIQLRRSVKYSVKSRYEIFEDNNLKQKICKCDGYRSRYEKKNNNDLHQFILYISISSSLS